MWCRKQTEHYEPESWGKLCVQMSPPVGKPDKKTWTLVWCCSHYPPNPFSFHILHSSGKSFQNVLACVCGFCLLIQAKEHWKGQVLLLDEKTWLTIGDPVNPKRYSAELSPGHLSSSSPDWSSHAFIELPLGTVMLEQKKGLHRTVTTRLKCIKMFWCSVVLTVPFTGNT